MSCIISDYEVDYNEDDIAVGPGRLTTVTATTLAAPLYVNFDSKWYLDQGNHRVAVPDYTTGAWSLTLPSNSETDPTPVIWIITRADGVMYQGQVPDAVPGPVTVLDLVNLYSWSVLVP